MKPNLTELCKNSHTLVAYRYPYILLPAYHTAVYQIIVGVEQRHSDDMLKLYANNLRKLADEAFRTSLTDTEAKLVEAMKILNQIAEMPRKTREQRLAHSFVTFFKSMQSEKIVES